MRLSARVRANRRNARRSTGPRTSEGKSRVAKNAVQHGLAIPVTTDPTLADASERLARVIAGHDVDPARARERGASPKLRSTCCVYAAFVSLCSTTREHGSRSPACAK